MYYFNIKKCRLWCEMLLQSKNCPAHNRVPLAALKTSSLRHQYRFGTSVSLEQCKKKTEWTFASTESIAQVDSMKVFSWYHRLAGDKVCGAHHKTVQRYGPRRSAPYIASKDISKYLFTQEPVTPKNSVEQRKDIFTQTITYIGIDHIHKHWHFMFP